MKNNWSANISHNLNGLQPLLQRLDRLISQAVDVFEMTHVLSALQREYQKMGQILRDRDLGQPFPGF